MNKTEVRGKKEAGESVNGHEELLNADCPLRQSGSAASRLSTLRSVRMKNIQVIAKCSIILDGPALLVLRRTGGMEKTEDRKNPKSEQLATSHWSRATDEAAANNFFALLPCRIAQ
jgi:hypothetical protein